MLDMFLTLLDTQEDKEKFAYLYDTYKNLMYWIAIKKTNCIEDAEECVQDTFFYAAKHFDRIGEVDSKRTKCYLSTIVSGFAIDIYNKSINESTAEFNQEIEKDSDGDAFNEFDSVEISVMIDKILCEQDKIFLYLKYVYGYKSVEIADIYGVNDTYVRKRIQRAKKKLKDSLSQSNTDVI